MIPKFVRGSIAPVFTAFHEDGRLDDDGQRSILSWLAGTKAVSAFFVRSGMGQMFSFSYEDVRQIAKTVCEHRAGNVPILVGATGIWDRNRDQYPDPEVFMRQAVELSKYAEDMGASGVVHTIPEAVQLVLQAAYMGQGGDIFVLKMGRAVKIRELAEKLILLAGKTPGRDIEIKYIGLREGEKMYEELFNEGESCKSSDHPLIEYAVGTHEIKATWEKSLDEIDEIVHRGDTEALLKYFKKVVENYNPLKN